MNKFLYWITGKLPCRIISDNGKPYLERYYLWTLLGVRFYIHRFVGSDPDRGMHDHPWLWARSIVLSGYYHEHTRYGVKVVRWYNKLNGESFHRVVLPKRKQCWTLFYHRAEYIKPWGFLTKYKESLIWLPFNLPGDGTATSSNWWLDAPKGVNEPRRAKLKNIKLNKEYEA